MLSAVTAGDHTMRLAIIAAIGPILGIVVGSGCTFLIERYKIKEARREAAETRRIAAERETEAQERFQEQLAAAKAIENRLREMMVQLTSQMAARGESQEDADETVDDLGLDASELNANSEESVHASEVRPITTNSGVRLLWVTPPLVETPRFVHFSWAGNSFKIRDYIAGHLQQNRGATPQPEEGFEVSVCWQDRDSVWASAELRLPSRAELFHVAADFGWWQTKLELMTRGRELLQSPRRSEWSKDRIFRALDQSLRRATYGAIAGIVGGAALGVMHGREKSPEYSWVVAASTSKATQSRRGWPTGYADDEIHPECLKQIHDRVEDFIAEPTSLMGWLEAVEKGGVKEEERDLSAEKLDHI